MKYIIPFIPTLVICSISALIAWTAGYDFNYRSAGVACWIGATVFMSILITGILYCPEE